MPAILDAMAVAPDSTGKPIRLWRGTDGNFTEIAVLGDPEGNQVGTASAPLRVDPTGTTPQPVSGTFWQATQPVSGPLTDTELRASPVGVSGTFFQATQPVSIAATVATDPIDRVGRLVGIVYGNVGQILQRAVSGDLQTQLRTAGTEYDARQIRTLTPSDSVDVSDRSGRLVGVVYGSQGQQLLQRAVSFDLQVQLRTAASEYDARQIRTLTASDVVVVNQGTANATPWNENIAQWGGTNVLFSLAGAPAVGGDTADGAADAGKSLKIGGKVTLNSAALPAALTVSQRGPLMVDEYGRPRTIVNRPKLTGVYYFHSGRLTVLAAAHGATAGFFWIINPVGSAAIVYLKKLRAQVQPTAATAFASAPRVTVERVTFTGVASGATVTTAKRDSTDATQVSSVRTASTGLTLTGGAVVAAWLVPAIMTAVGGISATEQLTVDQHDDDDLIVLRAGEGVVIRQADAGTTSDTRLLTVDGEVEER